MTDNAVTQQKRRIRAKGKKAGALWLRQSVVWKASGPDSRGFPEGDDLDAIESFLNDEIVFRAAIKAGTAIAERLDELPMIDRRATAVRYLAHTLIKLADRSDDPQ